MPAFSEVQVLFRECAARYGFSEKLKPDDFDLVVKKQVIACAERSRDIPFATWANAEFANDIKQSRLASAWFEGLPKRPEEYAPSEPPRSSRSSGLGLLGMMVLTIGVGLGFILMRHAVGSGGGVGPSALGIVGCVAVAFGLVGLESNLFDEMAGMIPFFAAVFGAGATIVAVVWGMVRSARGE